MSKLTGRNRIAISLDTTRPAARPIQGLARIPVDELKEVLDYEIDAIMSCPTTFRIAIVQITRLRSLVARHAKLSQSEFFTATRSALDSVWLFDTDQWIKEHYQEKSQVPLLVTKIYSVAVRLYGILTLPPAAVSSWATGDILEAFPKQERYTIYQSVRMGHQLELLRLLRLHWDDIKYKACLTWPLIVAAVAVGKGSVDDQIFVDECIDAIYRDPQTICGFFKVLQKLRAFWRSGETGWEDCFDEIVACTP